MKLTWEGRSRRAKTTLFTLFLQVVVHFNISVLCNSPPLINYFCVHLALPFLLHTAAPSSCRFSLCVCAALHQPVLQWIHDFNSLKCKDCESFMWIDSYAIGGNRNKQSSFMLVMYSWPIESNWLRFQVTGSQGRPQYSLRNVIAVSNFKITQTNVWIRNP